MIVFKGLSLKQMKCFFLKGEGLTLMTPIDPKCFKMLCVELFKATFTHVSKCYV